MTLDRRSVLTMAAGAGAALSGLQGARAAAPVAGTQVPGIYRYKVGDYEVTAISEGVAPRKLDAGFVRNVALPDVQKELEANFLPKDEIRITFTTLAVNTGSKVLLIDTGFADNGPASAGNTPSSLAAAGIDPKAVDLVVISHFHGDHIMGVRRKDGSLTYANAGIMVPAPEWDFWMSDDRMAQAPDGLKGGFQTARRVFGPSAKDIARYDWGKEIAPGITAIAAPGHTPGHTAFLIERGGDRLLIASDCTNASYLNLRNPEWKLVFDMDPDQAIATRRKVFDMAAAERMQVSAYHWSFPATGFIVKDGARYDLMPVNWSPVI